MCVKVCHKNCVQGVENSYITYILYITEGLTVPCAWHLCAMRVVVCLECCGCPSGHYGVLPVLSINPRLPWISLDLESETRAEVLVPLGVLLQLPGSLWKNCAAVQLASS